MERFGSGGWKRGRPRGLDELCVPSLRRQHTLGPLCGSGSRGPSRLRHNPDRSARKRPARREDMSAMWAIEHTGTWQTTRAFAFALESRRQARRTASYTLSGRLGLYFLPAKPRLVGRRCSAAEHRTR